MTRLTKRGGWRLLLMVMGWFVCCNVWALVSPVTMLDGVASRVIRSLEANKSRLRSMSVIRSIVNRNLVPYLDRNSIAANVVGRQYWRQASSSQRSQFIKVFTNTVIKTYANAFASYDGDKVKIYPLRMDYRKNRYVNVKSVLIRRNGQRIAMTYALARSGASWRIYDFSIEGVGLVQSYRSQFSSTLRSGGLKGLLAALKRRQR